MYMRTEKEQNSVGINCLLGRLHRRYTYKSGMLVHSKLEVHLVDPATLSKTKEAV